MLSVIFYLNNHFFPKLFFDTDLFVSQGSYFMPVFSYSFRMNRMLILAIPNNAFIALLTRYRYSKKGYPHV